MSRDAEELRDSATDMTRAIDELDMQLTTLRTLAFDVIINTHTHTHTHTRLMALCPGLPG